MEKAVYPKYLGDYDIDTSDEQPRVCATGYFGTPWYRNHWWFLGYVVAVTQHVRWAWSSRLSLHWRNKQEDALKGAGG